MRTVLASVLFQENGNKVKRWKNKFGNLSAPELLFNVFKLPKKNKEGKKLGKVENKDRKLIH